MPVIHGAGVTAPVARRWKTQVNEVAKLPAFFTELPEGDHNELEGWEGARASGARFSAIFLEDADQHPRERRRFELTAGRSQATSRSWSRSRPRETRPPRASSGR